MPLLRPGKRTGPARKRKVLTLVYSGLRDGHIRCLADSPRRRREATWFSALRELGP
jgi:hypothetical protein